MHQSITYKSVPVKSASLHFLKHISRNAIVHVGIDIGKNKIFVVCRWSPSRSKRVMYENPWLVQNPDDLPILIKKLLKIKAQIRLFVAFESTGSYGDPLRQSLDDAGIICHQVRTKLTHDYAEVFDGVPSQHDGKDAAVIAELLSQGKASAWEFPKHNETESEIKYIVANLIDGGKDLQRLQGKLEGLLARYWPGITKIIPLTSKTLLKLLYHYGGPEGLRNDKESAAMIRKFSCGRMTAERTGKIVVSARTTSGVRQGQWDIQYVKDVVEKMIEIHKMTSRHKKRLADLIDVSSLELQRLAKILGVATASVVWCRVGNPLRFHCADAWVKAMGLNLMERSSGEYQSRLRISKRGDSETRRWLFLSALRWTQDTNIKPWYERKKLRTGSPIRGEATKRTAGKAVIAVLRKLLKGIWHAIVKEEPFDTKILFQERSSRKKDRKVGIKNRRKRSVKSSKSQNTRTQQAFR